MNLSPIEFVHHSTLDSRVMKKKKTRWGVEGRRADTLARPWTSARSSSISSGRCTKLHTLSRQLHEQRSCVRTTREECVVREVRVPARPHGPHGMCRYRLRSGRNQSPLWMTFEPCLDALSLRSDVISSIKMLSLKSRRNLISTGGRISAST